MCILRDLRYSISRARFVLPRLVEKKNHLRDAAGFVECSARHFRHTSTALGHQPTCLVEEGAVVHGVLFALDLQVVPLGLRTKTKHKKKKSSKNRGLITETKTAG